ncbi:MAG: DUF3313 domain-containing protein [Gammaproteobacteria bacterium]
MYKEMTLRGFVLGMVVVLCLLLASACTTTRKAPVTEQGIACGFLGDICTKLTPGGQDQASLRYVNPTVRWTKYNKVLIDPVTYWGGSSTRLSGSDQHLLVNFFHQQLNQELSKKFTVVDRPGSGVLKIDVAVLDAEAAAPGLRSVSMVIPQAHLLSNLDYLATGKFPFAGGVEGAAKVSDSQTGEVLGAAVDHELGGGSIESGFQWEWGDAENGITEWCKKMTEKLSSWTTGTASP